MRKIFRFLFSLVALLACCVALQAQVRRTRPTPRTNAPVTSALAQPKWQILTQTDAEDGQVVTLVSLQPFPLAVPTGARYTMLFGVNYSYTDNDSTHVQNISLNIFSNAPTCHFPPQASLVLRVGTINATLPYQPNVKGADGVFWVSSDTEGLGCADSLGAFISLTSLKKLAVAQSLSGKIGDEAFQFTADDFAALRDLVSRATGQRFPPLLPRGVRR
jgi:hypothetical protein